MIEMAIFRIDYSRGCIAYTLMGIIYVLVDYGKGKWVRERETRSSMYLCEYFSSIK